LEFKKYQLKERKGLILKNKFTHKNKKSMEKIKWKK
jgi:hypothetical protein